MGQSTCCGERRCHVRDLKLGVLEFGDRLTELPAFFNIVNRLIQTTLGASQGTGRDVQATAVEPGHGDIESRAFRADAVADWYSGVFEVDHGGGLCMPAKFALIGAEADARGVLLHHQTADTAMTCIASSDHADINFVYSRTGDERLAAI